jgi:hypothetical protein
MCGVLIKCAALIAMIHGFRALSRAAGPQLSGLALGLPSTTALVLIVCGSEQGSTAATAMSEGSILGLVAAVALPLGYLCAVRHGWRLLGASTLAVSAFVVVASGLGLLPAIGPLSRLGIAALALVVAAQWVKRIPVHLPNQSHRVGPASIMRTIVLRTSIPALYVLILVGVQLVAGPRWAGLVSTFPSMSFVVLLVTHLEVGPLEASRIARVLPAGNASTLAFLAAFRLTCPENGVMSAAIAGYAAAVTALLVIDELARRPRFAPAFAARLGRYRPLRRLAQSSAPSAFRQPARLRIDVEPGIRRASRHGIRSRSSLRCGFAPLVEPLVS